MFLRFNFYTIVWALLILALILLPGQQMPEISVEFFLSIDKLAHAFVFCVLVLLMIVGFTKQFRYPALRNNAVRYSLIISTIYAVTLEILQFLSSERMVEFLDATANLVGCISGYLIFLAIYRL
ncbi:VanZ family protein [Catalinimonas locisalis]|uniref:VanZ family protein n=1 Tax=Catalinimonas locisalis TaxID=3133978 RepID=UPI00403F52F7